MAYSFFKYHNKVNKTTHSIHRMEFHQQLLEKHCRVCGKRLLKAKVKTSKVPVYQCSDHTDTLLSCFGIDLSDDASSTHPGSQICYVVTKRAARANTDGVPYTHSTTIMSWTGSRVVVLIERKHVNNTYVNTLKEFDGGRAKQERPQDNQGCRSGEPPRSILQHMDALAPPSLLPPEDLAPECYGEKDVTVKLDCLICMCLLNRPPAVL